MRTVSYWLSLTVLALALLVSGVWLARTLSDGSPLVDYVARTDDSYSWSVFSRHTVDRTDVVELRLRSQTWRGQSFRHRLFLIKPASVRAGGQGVLVLSGGRWREAFGQPASTPSLPNDAAVFFAIASQLESVVAVLDQVPYQPLFDRTEDELVAYTFDQFQRTGDEDWPVLLPMVKSAVRGMDAVQAAVSEEFDIDLDRFTLVGGSKRGWTTWLTAAVDRRVTAIAPIVFDALNMESHFPHQTAMWGQPSEKILPYTNLNLHNVLSSDEGRALREIVDPFAYRSLLTQPKLIVNATNDEYFPVDSANLYWPFLQGPSYALYLPNEGHNVRDFRRLISSLNALHRQAAGLYEMPEIEWEYALRDAGLRLCVRADPAPAGLVIWTALSDDRDFRDEEWLSSRVRPADRMFIHEQARPGQGYVAVFAELQFRLETSDYRLSTTPAVLGVAGNARTDWSAINQGEVCD